jgi:hypothetical protein
MAVRTPTPELVDAMRHDVEKPGRDPHVRHLIPTWGRMLMWGAVIGTVVAIVWRFGGK